MKAALTAALAFVLGAAVYFIIVWAGNTAIEKNYLSDEDCQQRETQYVEAFEQFVADRGLSSQDTWAMKTWCRSQTYVYLSIYKNNELFYETDGTVDASYDVPDADSTGQDPIDPFLYPVKFADGTFGVYLYEWSETKYYNMVSVVGLTAAFAILIATILISNGRMIRKVIRLSNDVKEVRDGNLNKEISSKGDNEFTQLCSDVNEMRMSIIKHYESEQEAWKANSELLTSISHDIRTPLTALIGYAEILADDQLPLSLSVGKNTQKSAGRKHTN